MQYEAQRRNIKGVWIPVLRYGTPLYASDIVSIKWRVKELRSRRYSGSKALKGRVRIVKATYVFVDKTTVIKEVV